MKNIIYILLIFSFLGCKQSIKPTDLAYLNGYWEIKKVTLPDETIKEYSVNQSIDFIELDKNNKGFRKKLVPQLDGKFLTSDVAETLEIITKKDDFYIKYTTKFTTWEEKIIKLTKDEFVVTNEHSFEYLYQRMKK